MKLLVLTCVTLCLSLVTSVFSDVVIDRFVDSTITGEFENSLALFIDLDGDGINEIIAGDPTGNSGGSIYVLWLNSSGVVVREQQTKHGDGNLVLSNVDKFGSSVAVIDDLDGDGIPEIAVGAYFNEDGPDPYAWSIGAIHIVFLNSSGMIKRQEKISSTTGLSALKANDYFGISIVNFRDLDGDGINELLVGSLRHPIDDQTSAIYTIYLNSDGTLKDYVITEFPDEKVGRYMKEIDDLDGDGINEILTSIFSPEYPANGMLVLYFNSTGGIKQKNVIAHGKGGFEAEGSLDRMNHFSLIDDLDGDGLHEIALFTHGSDIYVKIPEVYILYMNSSGMVKNQQKISYEEGSFITGIEDFPHYGIMIDDLDNNGHRDMFYCTSPGVIFRVLFVDTTPDLTSSSSSSSRGSSSSSSSSDTSPSTWDEPNGGRTSSQEDDSSTGYIITLSFFAWLVFLA